VSLAAEGAFDRLKHGSIVRPKPDLEELSARSDRHSSQAPLYSSPPSHSHKQPQLRPRPSQSPIGRSTVAPTVTRSSRQSEGCMRPSDRQRPAGHVPPISCAAPVLSARRKRYGHSGSVGLAGERATAAGGGLHGNASSPQTAAGRCSRVLASRGMIRPRIRGMVTTEPTSGCCLRGTLPEVTGFLRWPATNTRRFSLSVGEIKLDRSNGRTARRGEKMER
jgi:hypothetical protein